MQLFLKSHGAPSSSETAVALPDNCHFNFPLLLIYALILTQGFHLLNPMSFERAGRRILCFRRNI